MLLCVLLFLFSALLSLLLGSSSLSLGAILNPDDSVRRILVHVRLPRTLAAALAGMALAASGTIIQTVMDNPLAGPNLIGVNAGAGLAAVLCTAFLPAIPGAMATGAFLGALSALLLIYAVAKEIRETYDDIKKLRFNHMLNVLKNIGGENALSKYKTYGIENYYYVFETMVDKAFKGITENERKRYNPVGLWKLNGSTQLNFPIFIPDEYQIKGFVFMDYGILGKPPAREDTFTYMGYTQKNNIDDNLRTSAGVGIYWNTPMGPMNFSWGWPLRMTEYDREQRFLLSFETQF